MSEQINGRKVFTLLEVTRSIQKTIANRYKDSYWIKAEMNKLNFYSQSGHCYPDLVEKVDGRIVSQLRANLWKDDFNRINADFIRILNEPLKDGVKVLIQATIGFTPEHGFSLRILDIDPSFTLGDLEREKQETIRRLQLEGIYLKNKQLTLPALPQRIALISVQTSKGYADFSKVLEAAKRNWGYSFFFFLFPSLLQGDNAVGAIIQQLKRIKKVIHHFDAVAIVRGGGGDIGLSCYNHYDLAREIALFPIPVITGIGHATNETVTEMVAFENAITPTKLADFLVQKLHNFSVPVKKAEESIVAASRNILWEEKTRFAAEVRMLRSTVRTLISHHRSDTALLAQSLSQHAVSYWRVQKQVLLQMTSSLRKDVAIYVKENATALTNLEQNTKNLSPANVLRRGYSITQLNGKSVRSTGDVNTGDVLTTVLVDGTISSTVTTTNNEIQP